MTPTPLSRTPPAYPVPWLVDRIGAHPVVRNIGLEPLEAVRAHIADSSRPAEHETWGLVLPGDRSEMCLCAFDESAVAVTLAWRRAADPQEYLWRFVL